MAIIELHRQKLIEIGKIRDKYLTKIRFAHSLLEYGVVARDAMIRIGQILDADELKSNEEDFMEEKKRSEDK